MVQVSIYDGFWLVIEYTPLHTNLAWRLGRYAFGVYSVKIHSPTNTNTVEKLLYLLF